MNLPEDFNVTPTDYVKREERVDERKLWLDSDAYPKDVPKTDTLLLTVWTCTGFLLGWVAAILYYST